MVRGSSNIDNIGTHLFFSMYPFSSLTASPSEAFPVCKVNSSGNRGNNRTAYEISHVEQDRYLFIFFVPNVATGKEMQLCPLVYKKAKSYEVKSCEMRLPVNYGERTRDFDENGRDKRKQTFFLFLS